jgi:putative flippase GtrA
VPGVRAPQLVPRTALQRAQDFVRHPNNHKQALRFLCVGGSGYVVNLTTFAVCVHLLGIQDTVSFILGFLVSTANNFWWNRNWTFDAAHHHIARQGVRFLLVSVMVNLLAYGVYETIAVATGVEKVLADALAYIIVTPVSFLVQKLWSFKA